jgi:hypothetical protein
MPAFQPYWGKPAVRNDRGDGGNVGIIRSPLRATVPPDCGGRSAMVVPTATVTRSISDQGALLRITVDNRGGLKGSMQHWLAVYPPEFQIPMFFVAVD